jgi:hypothetical protein
VSVNDRPVTIKQGLVDELLILPEGLSTITIEVVDPAGNHHTRTVQVAVDTVDPVLTLDPLPQRTSEPQVTVTGMAEGAKLLFLDDEVVELEANGSFSVNVSLEEGANDIRFLCRDGVGHEATASARVVRDSTPPFLRLVLPGMEEAGNGTWKADQRRVTVQVVSEPGASITLNGVYVLVGEDGTANVDVALEDETNKVTVLVVDDLGNSQEVRYTIIYEPAGEVVAGLDWMALISTIVILALLVAIVLVVVKYRSMVKRMSRRRGPPKRRNGKGRPPNGRPPGGRAPNGNGKPPNGNGGTDPGGGVA